MRAASRGATVLLGAPKGQGELWLRAKSSAKLFLPIPLANGSGRGHTPIKMSRQTKSAPFHPAFDVGAYRLDRCMDTHMGPIGVDEPLTYLCHTPGRKGEPARVRVECERGTFYVDADRLAAPAK